MVLNKTQAEEIRNAAIRYGYSNVAIRMEQLLPCFAGHKLVEITDTILIEEIYHTTSHGRTDDITVRQVAYDAMNEIYPGCFSS